MQIQNIANRTPRACWSTYLIDGKLYPLPITFIIKPRNMYKTIKINADQRMHL